MVILGQILDYSKTFLSGHSEEDQNIGFQDR